MDKTYTNEIKNEARYLSIIKTYRELANRQSVPPQQQYWCLCGKQVDSPASEIRQLVDSGLIRFNQYCGIDRNEDYIDHNLKLWSGREANFFHGGWSSEIRKAVHQDTFNPAIVYLDSTNLCNNPLLAEMAIQTMRRCWPQTLFIVNACLENPHCSDQFDPEIFVQLLNRKFTRYDTSAWQRLPAWRYRGDMTMMVSYCYWRT